jgi:hypothetical protein
MSPLTMMLSFLFGETTSLGEDSLPERISQRRFFARTGVPEYFFIP